jgi:hypothetical protein
MDVRETSGTREPIELQVEMLPGHLSAEYGNMSPSTRLRLSCSAILPMSVTTQFFWAAG